MLVGVLDPLRMAFVELSPDILVFCVRETLHHGQAAEYDEPAGGAHEERAYERVTDRAWVDEVHAYVCVWRRVEPTDVVRARPVL